ncbi:MAG: asparagine synthase-related protein [Vicinamibacterales bacterium]
MFKALAASAGTAVDMAGATIGAIGFRADIRSPRGCTAETPRVAAAAIGRMHEWDGRAADTNTALRSLAEAYEVEGPGALRKAGGVFGVVLWDKQRRTLVAARDAVGVEAFYYRVRSDQIEIGDRLDMFEGRRELDDEYVATFVIEHGTCADRTVWSDIRPVPAGSVVSWHDGRERVQPFWTAESIAPRDGLTLDEAAQTFRTLLERAVAGRLDTGGRTWAQLSGGLDSSSVVSTAAALGARRGTPALGGTVTLTDSLGNADESAFVDATVRQYTLPNLRLHDEWPWRDDGEPPPTTDQPARDYPFYARDRRLGALIRAEGGTSLLSGVGPDHLLPTSSAHIADLAWHRRWSEALGEMRRWAIGTRMPLTSAIVTSLMPLWDPSYRARRDADPIDEVVTWFQPAFARRHALRRRVAHPYARTRTRGRLYQGEVASHVGRIAGWLPAWFSMAGVEMRHPFLDLPLVELCLALPYRCSTDVARSKPVLRRAMKGILAEEVRLRTTKSMIEPRICWAFAREHARLSRLLRDPVLADLGCIEPRRIRRALDGWVVGAGRNAAFLYAILALETWLSTKSGRCAVHDESSVYQRRLA